MLARDLLAVYAPANTLPSEAVQALRTRTRTRRDLVQSQTAARQRLQDELVLLCLLIYRMAEHRIRQRLAEMGATVPDQIKKPTRRPIRRRVFQCFEGISLVLMQREARVEAVQVTGLTEVHLLFLGVFGPLYEQYYGLST